MAAEDKAPYRRLTTTDGPVSATNPLPVGVALGAPALSRASVNVTTATTTPLVSATAAQIIRVYRVLLVIAGANNLSLLSAAAALHGGALVFPGPGSLVLDFSAEPWFVCGTNEALNLVTTQAVQVSGVIYYTKG